MKKLFLGIFSFLLLAGVANAQVTGKKAMKEAQKSYNAFKLANTETDKIKNAMEMIDVALEDAEISAEAKAWKLKGDIYNAAVGADVAAAVLNPQHESMFAGAGMEAYKAYAKLLEIAEKKYDKKSALEGMKEASGSISNTGITAYEKQDYETAYNSFNTVVEVHEILSANDMESILTTEDDVNNQIYITGLAALNGNMLDKATPVFMKLKEKGYEKSAVYEGLYKIKTAEGAEEEALKILEEGRVKFPDDVSLIFAEINYYLKANRLDELVGKLKTAIDKEPENVSLYSTLGNVYDNLFQRELEAGNDTKADEYFDSAMTQYKTALEKKADYSDAIYSIGALYYNKAAAKTKQMNDLPLSETKKFEVLQKEVATLFDEALPYFLDAEKLNPKDMNTLIALKEIYARKNDFEKSKVYKERIDAANN